MAEGDRLLPLINRPTPVMDRLRGRNGSADSVSKMLATGVAQSQRMENEDLEQDIVEFISSFKSNLAKQLDVEEEAIDDEYVETVATLLFLSEREDVLTTKAADAVEEMEEAMEDVAEKAEEREEGEEKSGKFSST